MIADLSVDAAMFNANAGRSLADARDNKNRPSSTIAGYMDHNTRVPALNKNPAVGLIRVHAFENH